MVSAPARPGPAPQAPHPPPSKPGPREPGGPGPAPGRSGYELVLPWLAGLTVVCASTALSGVITGGGWLGYVLCTEIVLIGTGLVLRLMRTPALLVAVGQMFALCCVTAALFTDVAVAGFLPGAAALRRIGELLGQSVHVIRDEMSPVAPSAPILCLAIIAVGLVAIIVDVLVVPGQAPAAVGLMLLCVYAVPASLSDAMLPWWTFVLGAVSFTALLAADRVYRQRAWRSSAAYRGVLAESGPQAAGIVAVSMVVALLAGAGVTAVGTDGRLPGDSGGGSNGPAQLGIKPFTTLRGLLDNQQNPKELFRVRGLGDDPPYLRSLTLRDYIPNRGWRANTSMASGVAASQRPLPGSSTAARTTRVQIESVNWRDVWLPVYGVPRQFDQLSRDWRYDEGTGIVYSQRARNPGRYSEVAQLGEPSADELRKAPQTRQIDPAYLRVGPVNPRVRALAERLTANAPTEYDKAAALYNYFVVTGGFTYSTATATPTDADALADFVLNGKKGFCEQYASAMAVMLRALGVPSRVAIGFTPGQQKDGYRSISSTDAHAWVEVYFAGYGWQTFDPTPLTDGRSHTPNYLRPGSGANSPAGRPDRQPGAQTPDRGQDTPSPNASPEEQQRDQAEAQARQASSGPGVLVWLLVLALAVAVGASAVALTRPRSRPATGWLAAAAWVVSVVLAAAVLSWWLLAAGLLVLLALLPAALRGRSARARTVRATGGTVGAVDAAWAEVTAASVDRGVPVASHETLRGAAEMMIHAHRLDVDGQQRLRELVTMAERAWYRGEGPQQPPAAALTGVLDALQRCAPLDWRARLLPRSVPVAQAYRRWLPRLRRRAQAATSAGHTETSTDRDVVGGRR